MALTTRVDFKLVSTLTGSQDHGTPTFAATLEKVLSLASGTGINQADKLWIDNRTVAAGATDSIDVQAALTDAFGAAFTPAKLKLIVAAASSSNTVNLTIGRPSAGVPFISATATIPLHIGGFVCIFTPAAAGIAVTATTADLIDIVAAAGSGNQTYDIALVGTSA